MISLKIEVPIACFRQSRAREYAETYPVPPPSTIYGMLLSMVGEMDRYKHCGVELAIAMLSNPVKSTVIRTFRRFKKKEIADPTNARPDYQELLTDIELVVFLEKGADLAAPNLCDRLRSAFASPQSISRFGGLCLGESRDLVNSVQLLKESDRTDSWRWLVQDEDGILTLPYWVDHVGSKGTRERRYNLREASQEYEPPTLAWTSISTKYSFTH
ncbi:type I-MYXAN CRISPR-associated protein Cas5/Cmx5/DevS [Pseudanabaena sp. PCC 6802]|uniref:type I-MYXAN CRISPR-associated protein Cas5/Cmx5/DevS n=1 Tax=Pseudanabaena sp. PCC 6802 TaxID=118173 RepID=UPI00034B06F1|nr:type I-MYXAN CRISPR-associated protein Cas5/Cmx5/DevS [Pseudanabaena sp. PCC 6802]